MSEKRGFPSAERMDGRFTPCALSIGNAILPLAHGYEKRRRFCKRRPFLSLARESVRTARAGGTRAVATAPPRVGQGNLRFDGKTHVRQVDGDAADRFEEIIGDAIGESVLLDDLVFGSRLIQSQSETRAASATSSEVDTNGGLFLVGEVGFKLVTSRVAYGNHGFSSGG